MLLLPSKPRKKTRSTSTCQVVKELFIKSEICTLKDILSLYSHLNIGKIDSPIDEDHFHYWVDKPGISGTHELLQTAADLGVTFSYDDIISFVLIATKMELLYQPVKILDSRTLECALIDVTQQQPYFRSFLIELGIIDKDNTVASWLVDIGLASIIIDMPEDLDPYSSQYVTLNTRGEIFLRELENILWWCELVNSKIVIK